MTARPKTTCPDCGVTVIDCRRYRLEDLATYVRMSVNQACIRFGIGGTTQKRAMCHGITRQVVDRIAGELREHPSTIWPEIVDHDIEDHQRPCEECEQPFFPRDARNVYCSERCGHRRRAREYVRRRTATDPVYREAQREYGRRYRAEAKRALNAYARRYRRENTEQVREYDRRYKAAKKDELARKRRERYLSNREAELAKQRVRDQARRGRQEEAS